MINELYKMYRGLEKVDVLPSEKHNDIQFPGMGTTFRVLLGKEGEVKSFNLMTKEQIKNCWSIGDGFKNQFPAVKLTFPFISEAYKQYKEWRETNKKPSQTEMVDFISTQMERYKLDLSSISEWPGYRKKIIGRKKTFESDFSNENFYKLFERFELVPKNGVHLLEEVYEIIKRTLNERPLEELQEIANALFGTELDAKGLVKDGKRITFIVDTFPLDDIDRFASSIREVPKLSKALFDLEKNTVKQKQIICSLTNKASFPVEKKFPSEKLSVIGNTIIFAKSDTSGPTVQRYGKWKTDAFDVDKELVKKLSASISFLASENQANITWKKVPSNSGNTPNLLLAYCLDDPSIPIGNLISYETDIEDIDDYQNATASVLRMYKDSNLKPDASVEIIEIISLDKANRKVNFSYSTSLDKLFAASQYWNLACNNAPDFKLFCQIGKENKLLSPWIIEPIKFNFLSKYKYIRDGSETVSIPGMSFAESMRLFFSLNLDIHEIAEHWLGRLSAQYQALFSLCSQTKSHYLVMGNLPRHQASPKLNTQALLVTTLLSILLFKLNRTKEIYMNEFAYQLGQLCSALDELHIAFCHAERGGDVPTTTIGNMLYGMALQSPEKALSVLASRIKPYEAWVKRSKHLETEDKAIKAGHYASGWITTVAPHLHQHINVQKIQTTDFYKTELMLGYLAGRPFEGKKSTTKDSQNEGDK